MWVYTLVDFPIKRLLVMVWILIGVLLLVNVALSWRIGNFSRDCAQTHDVDGLCPCKKTTNKVIDNPGMLNITILENIRINSSTNSS